MSDTDDSILDERHIGQYLSEQLNEIEETLPLDEDVDAAIVLYLPGEPDTTMVVGSGELDELRDTLNDFTPETGDTV